MSLTSQQVMDHVRDVLAGIAPEADLDTLAPDEQLRETLDLDSMDFLRLMQELATRIGIEVPESDYAQLATLGGLVAYLQKKS
jgi:acyl carrier protein